MSIRGASPAAHRTLVLTTLLHAFTHALMNLFVPMYLVMATDLRLRGVGQASLIVTVYGVVYFTGAWAAGLLADRFDRRMLLGLGLLGNCLAVGAMGFTHAYPALVGLAVVAGLCGAIFHPAANALVPAHFPGSPGMAIGLLGIGSGVGFFCGTTYAGWRVKSADWGPAWISDWQRPLIEAAAAGLVLAAIYLLAAREAPGRHRSIPRRTVPLSPRLRKLTVLLASIMVWRDFAVVGGITLSSLYLQKAYGFDTARTGGIVGLTLLFSAVVNPIAVRLSHGRRRLVMLTAMLLVGGLAMASVPLWPAAAVVVPLALAQTLGMGSMAVSDAAMAERVDPDVRGRVNGLFLTIVGGVASLAPLAIGLIVDRMGAASARPAAYVPVFLALGVVFCFATTAVLVLRRIGRDPAPPRVTLSHPLAARVT